MTFLDRFIEEKLHAYEEPHRRGTPKGEPVGLSKTKYHASLLMLTNKKQKEIAKDIGISHSLLRKWNTEQAFKSVVENHYADFARRCIYEVDPRIKAMDMLSSSLIHPLPQTISYKDMNPEILLKIANVFTSGDKSDPNIDFFKMATLSSTVIKKILTHDYDKRTSRDINEKVNLTLKYLKREIITKIKEIISKEPITDTDRNSVYRLLTLLSELD